MGKRAALGVFGFFVLAVIAGNILTIVDPEGVKQREEQRNAADAATATAWPTSPPARAPTSTIWVVLTPRTTSTSTPVPAQIRVGSEATVRFADLERLAVAVDQRAMDDLAKASAAKDMIGWNQVIREGRAFWVNAGTRVLVLELDWDTTRVRLLEGPQAGRAGWLVSTNIKP